MPDLTVTMEAAGPSTRLRLAGTPSAVTHDGVRTALLAALRLGRPVDIDTAALEAVDIGLLQIFLAAGLQPDRAGPLRYPEPRTPALGRTLADAGLDPTLFPA